MLVYAVGADHGYREASRRLVDAVGEGRLSAVTSPEVIQEFAHVRGRRRARADAAEHARTYARLLAPLLTTSLEHLDEGLALYERHPGLGAFDAVLAAVALANGAEALVSADRAFTGIDGLNHVVPGEDGFEALLRG